MSLRLLSFWILLLTVGCLQMFTAARVYFSDERVLTHRLAITQKSLAHEKLQTQLAYYQLREFQQSVAEVMPQFKYKDYASRNIASIVMTPPVEALKFDTSNDLFEKGKKLFRNSEFEESVSLFKELIQNYPVSEHVVEANFLTMESYYRTGDIEECLDQIETLITLFPEHELTGFALIRMGQIFISQEKISDAIQILKLAKNNFDNKNVQIQAAELIKDISL